MLLSYIIPNSCLLSTVILLWVEHKYKMRLLSWNARGLGDDDKNDMVCTLLNDAKVDIICIQEIKLSEITVFKAKKFLPSQFSDFLFHPSDGTSAGLLIAWNPRE
jgi:exonuclease III